MTLACLTGPAAAGGTKTVSSVYSVSVGGLSVATLSLEAVLSDRSYSLSGSGRVTGIASVIAPTEGSSRSSGAFNSQRVLPQGFSHVESSRERNVSIDIDLRAGDVQKVAVAPRIEQDPQRVPVEARHMRDVLDPLSALIVRVPGDGPLVSERACNRSVPVFNGYARFDVALTYVGVREVRSEQGYSGPVVACEARYRPISGHRPWKASVKRAQQASVEVWLAPVEGTRVLLPYRAAVDTSLGRGVLQARRFEITGGERHVSSN